MENWGVTNASSGQSRVEDSVLVDEICTWSWMIVFKARTKLRVVHSASTIYARMWPKNRVGWLNKDGGNHLLLFIIVNDTSSENLHLHDVFLVNFTSCAPLNHGNENESSSCVLNLDRKDWKICLSFHISRGQPCSWDDVIEMLSRIDMKHGGLSQSQK